MALFPKGVSGNISGRPKANPLIVEARERKYEEFVSAVETLGMLRTDELKQLIKNKATLSGHLIYASLINECHRGNMQAIRLYFEYVLGKPKEIDLDALNVTAQNSRPLQNATPEQLKSILEGKVLPMGEDK